MIIFTIPYSSYRSVLVFSILVNPLNLACLVRKIKTDQSFNLLITAYVVHLLCSMDLLVACPTNWINFYVVKVNEKYCFFVGYRQARTALI